MPQRLNTKIFIERSNLIHNNKYDYSKSIYINKTSKIEVICKIHGLFYPIASNHMCGAECMECSRVKIYDHESLTKIFIQKATLIHGNKYFYNDIKYTNNRIGVEIICDLHNKFIQTPHGHLAGNGCPKCGVIKNTNNRSMKLIKFIDKSNDVHHNKYDYSKCIYINNHIKIKIICPNHGSFNQLPQDHLKGHGCSKCVSIISKPETAWLDSLNILLDNRNIKLPGLGRKRVDGYDSLTNTVYEFYGDYWHGNPNIFNLNEFNKTTKCTFQQLYNKTMAREEIIKSAGYSIIAIWESDYNKIINNAIKA